MNLEQLIKIMPAARTRAAAWVAPLTAAMTEFGITTPARQASFLSTIAHESGQLGTLVENLNYGAPGLLDNFPKYFHDLNAALAYARKPEKIASLVYANRMGNGDEKSGDGWKYRGRGLIQVTGHDNYDACGKALGYDLLTNPQFLESPALAVRSAAWWWNAHGCNLIADTGDQTAVCKRVNGGKKGLAERLALFEVAKKVLS